MKFVADANIPALAETFARHGCVQRVDGRSITRSDLAGADVLLVRSVTRVDRQLLRDTGIRFVGTATIGTDHLDIPWLESRGIPWASAPGCNADAAAQYTLAMMMLACRRLGQNLFDQQVGIIGHGNVGSRLHWLLSTLGISAVACDPPLEAAGETGLVSLAEALARPIVSLHVPLTRSGAYPTWHMLGKDELALMPNGGLLVNAARGEALDGEALLSAIHRGQVHAALDVWPGEPLIDPRLLDAATVATPHVAGYSEEGKLCGSRIVYEAFCVRFGLRAVPTPELSAIRMDMTHLHDLDCRRLAEECILAACAVERDDAALKSLSCVGARQHGRYFDDLRRNYSPRREFDAIRLDLDEITCSELLGALGFQATISGR